MFNPHAPSNRQSLNACYRKHENIKKRAYEQRIREVEHGTFTPLVMSLTGGLGNAATVCYKRLASLLCAKWNQPYSSTMAWIRCRLTFSLLRSAIQCIRGARSGGGTPAENSTPWTLSRLRHNLPRLTLSSPPLPLRRSYCFKDHFVFTQYSFLYLFIL